MPRRTSKEVSKVEDEQFRDYEMVMIISPEAAEERFEKVFARKELPDEMPRLVLKDKDVSDGRVWVIKMLVLAGFAQSNAEARRLVRQGGVRINQEEVTLDNCDVRVSDGDVLQAGKRRFAQITIEE